MFTLLNPNKAGLFERGVFFGGGGGGQFDSPLFIFKEEFI